jgi:HPt (histidine-containing phosphotransfer) domain-containing protein
MSDKSDKREKPDKSNDEIDTLLSELWQRHLPILLERLDILDRAAAAATAGPLAEPSRQEALTIAHKLSGNLGMFGYKRAGNIASQMEYILRAPTPEGLGRLSALASELRSVLASRL